MSRLAGLGLVLLALAAARPAAAEPALWVVRDADSTIYLFGTIHVLRPQMEWLSPRLEAALGDSSELWLETDVGSGVATAFKLLRYGMDFSAPLSSKLTPVQREQLAQAAAAAGMTVRSFEAMRPWLAAMVLSTVPAIADGYDDKAGADSTLQRMAKEAGKPLRILETDTQQLRFFADLPPDVEMAMLADVLARGPMPVEALDEMAQAWAAGDQSGVENAFKEEEFSPDGVLYDVLIRRRNLAWADRIKTMMDGAGTSFIAVGAGHLVGPDSVQAALGKLGLNAERL
ncbi:TraB/GumN family protein [Oleomonas cavernae]|uniref:TraB/GumN family protein n=1 Tax=Oleomonas cavernae TaxID=2320859 RepID=UPI001314FDBA|nr:TraB/GumN family protein [Oleomonas cavernae]